MGDALRTRVVRGSAGVPKVRRAGFGNQQAEGREESDRRESGRGSMDSRPAIDHRVDFLPSSAILGSSLSGPSSPGQRKSPEQGAIPSQRSSLDAGFTQAASLQRQSPPLGGSAALSPRSLASVEQGPAGRSAAAAASSVLKNKKSVVKKG